MKPHHLVHYIRSPSFLTLMLDKSILLSFTSVGPLERNHQPSLVIKDGYGMKLTARVPLIFKLFS